MAIASVAFRVTGRDDHFRSFGTAIADGDPKPHSESKRFPFHRSTPFDEKTWTVDCRKQCVPSPARRTTCGPERTAGNTLSACPHAARRVGPNNGVLRVRDDKDGDH